MFDIVVIGSSPLGILEALYHNNKGKKVLIIDKSNRIGGSWQSVSFPKIYDVENAIHYLLPSDLAFKFLKNNLNLELIRIKGKKTVYHLAKGINIYLSYDGLLSNLLNLFLNKSYSFRGLKYFLNKRQSLYFKKGAPSFIERVTEMLNKTSINIRVGEEINKIVFNSNVKLYLKSGEEIVSKKIVCTNSSRLKNIFKKENKIFIHEKVQKRPSMHLVLEDHGKFNFNQLIFFNNKVIKYAHDVTKFSSGDIKGKRILVIALKHELKETKLIFDHVHKILMACSFCSKNSKILHKKWTNVVLPRLFNEDLKEIKNKIGNQLTYLKTESLTHSIQEYYHKWKIIKT